MVAIAADFFHHRSLVLSYRVKRDGSPSVFVVSLFAVSYGVSMIITVCARSCGLYLLFSPQCLLISFDLQH